jgi:hypothetical protein
MSEIETFLRKEIPEDLSQLKERVVMAWENRMSQEEYEALIKAHNKQRSLFKGETAFDRQSYLADYQVLLSNPRYLVTKDLFNFVSLKQIIIDENAAENIKQEIDHWSMALALGFQDAVVGIVFNMEGEETKVQYFMHPGPPPERMTDEEVVKALKQITAAPKKLSDGDKYVLGLK